MTSTNKTLRTQIVKSVSETIADAKSESNINTSILDTKHAPIIIKAFRDMVEITKLRDGRMASMQSEMKATTEMDIDSNVPSFQAMTVSMLTMLAKQFVIENTKVFDSIKIIMSSVELATHYKLLKETEPENMNLSIHEKGFLIWLQTTYPEWKLLKI